MIHALIDRGTTCLSVQGTQTTITAEVLILVGSIYRKYNEQSTVAAEAFKGAVQAAIKDEIPFKSNEEVDKVINEKREKFMDKLKKSLREADN